MKLLKSILPDNLEYTLKGDLTTWVGKLTLDSREVVQNDMFCAIKGVYQDGHDYIEAAISNGATVIMASESYSNNFDGVTLIQVKDTAKALGLVASAYYDYPSRDLTLVGVTGTNGKTTVTTLLHQLFTNLGYKVGLISTVKNVIGDKKIPATHTTPNVIEINRLLDEMRTAKCQYIFMEVSSHAIHQSRIAGLEFDGGVFTNISHDHLDYHKDFKEYIDVKKMFFDQLTKDAFVLVNKDDKRGEVMLQNTVARKYAFSLKTILHYTGKLKSMDLLGMELAINGHSFFSRLIGEFNAQNLLAVYGVADLLGVEQQELLRQMSGLEPAKGRFQIIRNPNNDLLGIVDYAHTPDALENVLETIQKVNRTHQIITIVGCGGDRDKEKRPEMARIAVEKSSKIILTNDNPRSEDPQAIIDDMKAGIESTQNKKVLVIQDRKEAIKTAVMLSQDKTIILVAGKGHEDYQEINGKRFPFDDEKILRAFMLEDI